MTAADIRMIISDMPLNVSRPTTSALLLLDFAAAQGLSSATVLHGSGWTVASLSEGAAEISAASELHLIANAIAALGNAPALGLDMGVRYHLTAYGIWGFALMSAPTLRIAFETGLRYADLTYSHIAMQLTPVADELWLEMDASALPTNLQRFLVERDMAAVATMQRELFIGATLPRRIELAFAAPLDVAPYRQLFGLVPLFGGACNRIIFDARVLDQPLPQANPRAAQLAEAQCRQLLTLRRARSGLAAQVRECLLREIGGRLPGIEQVASHLNLTSRTLRRRLTAEGTSFSALLDELRQTLAEELLGTAGMKVAEVATRLGYAESASFLHARKRWRARWPAASVT